MEVKIETKYGTKKIQLEKVEYTRDEGNDCDFCSYKKICDKLTSINRLNIPVNESYTEDYRANYYRDFDLFCTYNIPIGYIPAAGTLEKNLPEIFPDAPIDDIKKYCQSYCIVSGCCETCVLNKWTE